MADVPADLTVENDLATGRYKIVAGEGAAFIAYKLSGNTIELIHTEVPAELKGHGIGGKLAHAALEDARNRNLKVLPLCPFVAAYVKRHPEFQDLVEL